MAQNVLPNMPEKATTTRKFEFNDAEVLLILEGIAAKEASATRALKSTRNPDLAKCYKQQLAELATLERKFN